MTAKAWAKWFLGNKGCFAGIQINEFGKEGSRNQDCEGTGSDRDELFIPSFTQQISTEHLCLALYPT